MKVGSSEDNDSLEVIIPVFVSAAFITMVLGTIAGKLSIVDSVLLCSEGWR